MKTCFSTLCCLNEPAEKVISYALANRMGGVEIRVSDKGEAFDGKTIADAGEIRSAFSAAGIVITDLALSCSIRKNDKAQIETGMNGIDFAAAAGSHAVRIFVGEHQSRFSDKTETDFDGIIDALGVLSDYGKEKDVEIWLETHSCFSSGKAMKSLIDRLAKDNVKVIWDVMHSLEYMETPEETAAFLGNSIVHVHLKDGHPCGDPDVTQYVHTDLGKGTVPVDEIIRILDSTGYNGYYSLEWESPWRPEIRSLYQETNELLANYNRFVNAAVN